MKICPMKALKLSNDRYGRGEKGKECRELHVRRRKEVKRASKCNLLLLHENVGI